MISGIAGVAPRGRLIYRGRDRGPVFTFENGGPVPAKYTNFRDIRRIITRWDQPPKAG